MLSFLKTGFRYMFARRPWLPGDLAHLCPTELLCITVRVPKRYSERNPVAYELLEYLQLRKPPWSARNRIGEPSIRISKNAASSGDQSNTAQFSLKCRK